MPKVFRIRILQKNIDKIFTTKDGITLATKISVAIVIIGKAVNQNPQDLVLANHKGDEFEDGNKTFKDYGFRAKASPNTINLINKADGGSQVPDDKNCDKDFPAGTDTESKECVVYKCTCECVEMDCGHYVSYEGLVGYVKSLKFKDRTTTFICPDKSCEEDWDLDDTLYYCNFNKKKHSEYFNEFRRRTLGEALSICPNDDCSAINKRKINVKIYRVACGKCGLNYCHLCDGKWLKSGFVLCGNKDCESYDKQRALDECSMLTSKTHNHDYFKPYWSNFGDGCIPKIRACPKCSEIIIHRQFCVHMKCPVCKFDFCFACLGDWNNNHVLSECQKKRPKPRQQL